jgi:hypothetical protein
MRDSAYLVRNFLSLRLVRVRSTATNNCRFLTGPEVIIVYAKDATVALGRELVLVANPQIATWLNTT